MEETRDDRLKKLHEDCQRALKMLVDVSGHVESNANGHVSLKATTAVSSVLPGPQTAFVFACLRELKAAVCINRKSHLWQIDPKADMTLETLEGVLKKGQVFTMRGKIRDPYNLQEVEISRVQPQESDKTRIQQLEEEMERLQTRNAQLEEDNEKLKAALRELAQFVDTVTKTTKTALGHDS